MKNKIRIFLATILMLPFMMACSVTSQTIDNTSFFNPKIQQVKETQSKDIKRDYNYQNYQRPSYGSTASPYIWQPMPTPDAPPAVQEYKGRMYYFGKYFASWQEWSDYLLAHPKMTTYGRYYYEGTQMMFRYCDPDTKQCFFFAIDQ